MRGRKPKPSHLRIVGGNAGKRPIPKNEPKPPTAALECPDYLADAAREHWLRLAPRIAEMIPVGAVDADALAAYCVAFARWKQAEDHLAKNGPIVKAPKTGVPMQNPFLSVANNAMAQMERWGSKFGLSPQDRVRLATDGSIKPASADPAEKYFSA